MTLHISADAMSWAVTAALAVSWIMNLAGRKGSAATLYLVALSCGLVLAFTTHNLFLQGVFVTLATYVVCNVVVAVSKPRK